MHDGCSYIHSLLSWHAMPPDNSGSTTSHGIACRAHDRGVQSPESAVDTLYIGALGGWSTFHESMSFPCVSYRTEYLT
eukprot:6248562-Prymnesium_polylepis.1